MNKLDNISMNGRMAYIIMCIEIYLTSKYPQKNWDFIAERLWDATRTNWDDWTNKYCSILPDILIQYDKYDSLEFNETLSELQFYFLKTLYKDITKGKEDCPSDEITYILNKPLELAMIYEGTIIGNGKESFKIIKNVESILLKNKITLPDYTKVQFTSILEKNGWGNDFDGKYLSIILNK